MFLEPDIRLGTQFFRLHMLIDKYVNCVNDMLLGLKLCQCCQNYVSFRHAATLRTSIDIGRFQWATTMHTLKPR